MFPIRDHNPSERRPFVVYALIALNVTIYLMQLPHSGSDHDLAMFWGTWALYPAAVTEYGDVKGILTSVFLHAGLLHLAGNMLFLWIFGDNLEDQMGHLGFLAFYLASGIAAGLTHVLSDPGSTVPTVGASGAIAGVMGGYLLLFPRAKVDILLIFIIFFKVFTIPAWIMLAIWFALQLFGGFGSGTAADGVAYWAHAGGFIAGLVLALPLWLRRGGRHFWDRTAGQPPHPEAEYGPSSIPTVRRRKR